MNSLRLRMIAGIVIFAAGCAGTEEDVEAGDDALEQSGESWSSEKNLTASWEETILPYVTAQAKADADGCTPATASGNVEAPPVGCELAGVDDVPIRYVRL